MPNNHLERLSVCSVFCSRGYSSTDTGFRHIQPSHNRSSIGIRLIYDRSSARRPCPQASQGHPRVVKVTSGRSSARRPYPQVPQGIPTCRTIQQSLSNRPQTGPRPVFDTATLPTGTPEPSPRGEEGLLTGLWHGDHAHKPLSGILAWRRWSSISARP